MFHHISAGTLTTPGVEGTTGAKLEGTTDISSPAEDETKPNNYTPESLLTTDSSDITPGNGDDKTAAQTESPETQLPTVIYTTISDIDLTIEQEPDVTTRAPSNVSKQITQVYGTDKPTETTPRTHHTSTNHVQATAISDSTTSPAYQTWRNGVTDPGEETSSTKQLHHTEELYDTTEDSRRHTDSGGKFSSELLTTKLMHAYTSVIGSSTRVHKITEPFDRTTVTQKPF